MNFKTYKSYDQCRKLWQKFSPSKCLFDIWEFRSCFFDKKLHQLHFITAKEGRNYIGLLPLMTNKATGETNYFGDWFPERNYIFIEDTSKMIELLAKCPDNTLIEGIDPSEKAHFNFVEDQHSYYIDLKKYNNRFANYFNSTFDKKKQKDIKRELKKIPKYKIHLNRVQDFDRMVAMNIRNFDGESIYDEPGVKEQMLCLVKKAQRMKMLNMISVEINGKVEGVDIAIKANGWYHVITGASNNHKIPNLGKLMNILSIKRAIKRHAKIIDFLATSPYWKTQWNFDKDMLYKFEKK
jgi:hypothetical protein